MEKLRTEERQLEIFELEYLEPYTARTAIDSLFADEGFAAMPEVDIDLDTQQMFIRATEEQMAEIRKLLIKMGETSLKSLQAGQRGRLRVIRFRGDAKAALEEIQRVWPQLRKNPVRVVTPSAAKEKPKPSPTPVVEEPENPEASDASLPPVFVVLGEGRITAACEDPEVLDQFESLLRGMSQSTAHAGRDYSIFVIRKTSAASVAGTLTQFFRDKMASRGRSSWMRRSRRLTIVPDERLNTLFVQGSRADREKIDELLEVLDTDELPEALAATKPRIIPIENTRASRIEDVIQDIFRKQLTATTVGTAAAMPAWLAPQISVDQTTNSLVVMAPSPLVDEIVELAQTLDKAAGDDPAQNVKIIRLKKASAEYVEEALRDLMRTRRRRSSR